jgi:hypothetical protein
LGALEADPDHLRQGALKAVNLALGIHEEGMGQGRVIVTGSMVRAPSGRVADLNKIAAAPA